MTLIAYHTVALLCNKMLFVISCEISYGNSNTVFPFPFFEQMMDLQHNAEISKTENRFVKVENYHLWPSAPHSTGSSEGAGNVMPNVFRRLQSNNTSTVSSGSLNLRASVVNANLSAHSTDSTKGSNSVSTSSTGSSVLNPEPNRVSSTDATSLATPRNIVAGHAHSSGSIAAGIPSATITTSGSASVSVSASASGTISTQAGYNSHHQVCARYMGSIGGTWPTVQVRIFVIYGILCIQEAFVCLFCEFTVIFIFWPTVLRELYLVLNVC